MFGYVVANREQLSKEQIERYQSCYCGLCHTIGKRHGTLQRLALNYDMTFLILLLSSLYEPDEYSRTGRCVTHPVTAHSYWYSEITNYAADLNIALAYHNCMDDWHDDKALKSLFLARAFQSAAHEVAASYPVQWQAICTCMKQLQEIEKQNLQEPDLGANTFGEMMGTLFVWKEDRWSPLLRQIGQSLGRFIYLMDAVSDVEKDIKSNSYNPLRSRFAHGATKEDYRPVLKQMIGECTDSFERLPLLQDLGLLRNILYSGVWCRFRIKESDSSKEVTQHV